MISDYLRTGTEDKCFGCSACEKFCPTNAITMEINEKGFRYPKIDSSACIKCGKCKSVCPCGKEDGGKQVELLYIVEHKLENVLQRSQSGGAFTALSDYILKNDGVCYGAIINDNIEVEHARAENIEQRDKMCGSKYVQSVIDKKLLDDFEQDCLSGKLILFTGTPCQSAMIKRNFGKYKNLIVCDFLCHGVPSPMVWKDYLTCRESEYGKIVKAKFRNKDYKKSGWYTESLYTEDEVEHISNMWASVFYSHLAHRESCFTCPYASEKRYSDITIGGFIDTQLIDCKPRYDLSMMFLNSDLGMEVFDIIKDDIEYKKCEVQYFKNQPCLYHPVDKPKEINLFWKKYNSVKLDLLLKECVSERIKKQYHLEF